jgi:Zn-dependent protease with chaperone function/type II secretory pathway pseudopilin PulG
MEWAPPRAPANCRDFRPTGAIIETPLLTECDPAHIGAPLQQTESTGVGPYEPFAVSVSQSRDFARGTACFDQSYCCCQLFGRRKQAMDELICPRERTLGTVTLVLGTLLWLVLLVGTFGAALLFLLLGFVAYLFAQSALIAHIRGNGVELSETQFPDLYAHFCACCDRLKLAKRPRAYILNGNGTLNAFATRFLGLQYVVLLSDVIDAMDRHAEGVRFYIGHELGHLHLRHLGGRLLRWPVLWMPLLGAAYSRAKETSCDRHGRACCSSPASAAHALAALSTGAKRWAKLDAAAYVRQSNETTGFWMSFHELIAGYPWTSKRFARVLNTEAATPARNPFAYLFALFVPYAGRLGAGFGFVVLVYILGVSAAISVPAYKAYQTRAALQIVMTQSQSARDKLAQYFEATHRIPATLSEVGVEPTLPDGSALTLDPKQMRLTVNTARGELIFVPQANTAGHVYWLCTNGAGLKNTDLPAACRPR